MGAGGTHIVVDSRFLPDNYGVLDMNTSDSRSVVLSVSFMCMRMNIYSIYLHIYQFIYLSIYIYITTLQRWLIYLQLVCMYTCIK